MNSKEFNLGHESSFAKFPTEVTIENESYFIVKNDNGYELLSTICPHAGGRVLDYGSELVCPMHYWTFDSATGKCKAIPEEGLTAFPIAVREGELIAELS